MQEPGNKKILAVEDERLQLNILEAFLKNETDCEIMTANNGKEAIEIINNQDISLILTDLMMPEIGGLELIKYVNKKSLDIPVIVMSSNTSLNSAIDSLKFGAYDYLVKPYEFDILRIVIHRALEKSMLTEKAKEAEKLQTLK